MRQPPYDDDRGKGSFRYPSLAVVILGHSRRLHMPRDKSRKEGLSTRVVKVKASLPSTRRKLVEEGEREF